MKRNAAPPPPGFPRHYQAKLARKLYTIERWGNPSEAARRIFNYVIAIGKTRCQMGQVKHRTPPHTAGCLIHFVNRGEYWHRVNGRLYRAGEGDICILDASKPFDQGNDRPRSTELWWVFFHGREAAHQAAELGTDSQPVLHHISRRRFQSLFHELWALTANKPLAHEARAHAVLAAILAELFVARAQAGSATRAMGTRRRSEEVQMAVDYMGRYLHTGVALKNVASAVGLSLWHFARRFHSEMGIAPMQYLNVLRIEQAQRLLATTPDPVAEIGRLVGIPNPNYFARLFRKTVGLSPRAYRENNMFQQSAPK